MTQTQILNILSRLYSKLPLPKLDIFAPFKRQVPLPIRPCVRSNFNRPRPPTGVEIRHVTVSLSRSQAAGSATCDPGSEPSTTSTPQEVDNEKSNFMLQELDVKGVVGCWRGVDLGHAAALLHPPRGPRRRRGQSFLHAGPLPG